LRLADFKYDFPKADNFSRYVGAALDDPFARSLHALPVAGGNRAG
jgi:hypothetical protein